MFKIYSFKKDIAELKAILHINESGLYEMVYDFLQDISLNYPKFNYWFFHTVSKELKANHEERDILVMLDGAFIVSVMIIKKSKEEKKVCTIKVHEGYRKQNIATYMFEQSIIELDSLFPKFTISENNFPNFDSIIKNFNFKVSYTQNSVYEIGKNEYYINY